MMRKSKQKKGEVTCFYQMLLQSEFDNMAQAKEASRIEDKQRD